MATGPSKTRGVAGLHFSKGVGGWVTLCQNEGVQQMSFSPPVVGCLLKKNGSQRGGGCHGHPRTPLATPLKTTGLAKFSGFAVSVFKR